MSSYQLDRPILRPLDIQPLTYEGMTYVHLRDPLALSDKTVLVPQPLIPLLPLLDGTHTLLQIQVALSIRYKLKIGLSHIENLISALDEALLLDNPHYHAFREKAWLEYRNAAYRPTALAGQTYPDSPDELKEILDTFLFENHNSPLINKILPIRGLLTPHIDYSRGGAVYAGVWAAASQAAQNAELVILLGTDHFSEAISLTLTRQNYATPFGVLPTDVHHVDHLARIIGQDAAFLGELHHRSEHSLELAAVWLHHIRKGKPVDLLPILCGPFDPFEDSSGSLKNAPVLTELIDYLRSICFSRPTLIVAAGDLDHIGPAFGGKPVSPDQLIQIRTDDELLLHTICSGETDAFYSTVQLTGNHSNICGTTAIYLALRLLEPVSGQMLAYSVCPADTHETSYVTIAGVALG